jgi:hypothetical protein
VSYAAAVAAGLVLRLWMLKKLFAVNGDTLLYGGLAKNLLLHGWYGLNGAGGEFYSSLIRLPGYPLFLAACFRLFGMENYFGVVCAQIALELLGCVLAALAARRVAPEPMKAAAEQGALWLAVLCPFTASYTTAPLPETPSILAVGMAVWAAARFVDLPRWTNALLFTFAVTWAALLRPDGALVAVALVPAILLLLIRPVSTNAPCPILAPFSWRKGGKPQLHLGAAPIAGNQKIAGEKLLRMAVVCALLASAPFAAWTWRNWELFHVFQPLAPRLATEPDEDPHNGWERWVKSWSLDFVTTYTVYWVVPDDVFDVSKLPARAFDSPEQYAETVALARDYNANGYELTPQLDARFEKLAEQRIAAHPLRYYVWLPLGRLADMWLRPRVEDLPIDLEWWKYSKHKAETRFAWEYAGLNALYLVLGLAGLIVRPKFWLAMLAYMVMRSALLLTVEAPEARYTLECFPMLFVLGGVAIGAYWEKLARGLRVHVE